MKTQISISLQPTNGAPWISRRFTVDGIVSLSGPDDRVMGSGVSFQIQHRSFGPATATLYLQLCPYVAGESNCKQVAEMLTAEGWE
jgi:hypothetical protein